MKKVIVTNNLREQQFNKIESNQRGITLVALVVTIVILIILATISINSILRGKWCD